MELLLLIQLNNFLKLLYGLAGCCMVIHLICFLVVYTFILLEFRPGDWFSAKILRFFQLLIKSLKYIRSKSHGSVAGIATGCGLDDRSGFKSQ
jgi:hypothetical protein